MRRRGFVFGDVHFPFHHPLLLALAVAKCIQKQPAYVVQIGDLYDKYSAAKFPRSYNVMTPRDERQWSRYYAEIFWQTLREGLPNAKFYQFAGNHCVRSIKRALEMVPEHEDELVDAFKEDMTFEGVETILDPREEFQIDDILFNHGGLTKLGAHHEYFLQSFVGGHTHTGGVVYRPLQGHLTRCTFEANAGYLANPFAVGLKYTLWKKSTKWTHGCLDIDHEGPKFIPLWPALAEQYRTLKPFRDLVEALTHRGLYSEDKGTVWEPEIPKSERFQPQKPPKGTTQGCPGSNRNGRKSSAKD